MTAVLPVSATAETPCGSSSHWFAQSWNAVTAGASTQCEDDSGTNKAPGNGSTRVALHSDPRAEWKKQAKAIIKRNNAAVAAYAACVAASTTNDCKQPALEAIPGFGEQVDGQPGALPPQLVAYTAAARLKLTPPKPVIGPPPSINPWKIAAVGYPLWLSTDADRDPPAVTDTVYDLTVRVRARLSKVIFDMGDGNTVSCTNLSRAWSRGVVPGTSSPTCGYRYLQPPRTGRTYTVSAHANWSVAVTINGTTYPVTLTQHASIKLPVGELQVVVR